MSKVWIVREKWRIPKLEEAELEGTEVVEKDIEEFVRELKEISEKWYVEGIFKEISKVMEEDIGEDEEVDGSMKRIRLEQLLKSQRDIHIGPYRSYGEEEITVEEIGSLCRMLRDLKRCKLIVWMPNEPKYAVYGPPMSCYWEVYGVPVKRVRIRR